MILVMYRNGQGYLRSEWYRSEFASLHEALVEIEEAQEFSRGQYADADFYRIDGTQDEISEIVNGICDDYDECGHSERAELIKQW